MGVLVIFIWEDVFDILFVIVGYVWIFDENKCDIVDCVLLICYVCYYGDVVVIVVVCDEFMVEKVV